MADPKRLKRAANGRWITGCCAVALSLLLAAQAFAVVTVTVGTSDGVPGGPLTLTMGLMRAATDPVVASADIDVIFDTAQIDLIGSCSSGGAECRSSADCGQGNSCILPCQLDPRLTQQSFTATSPNFPPVPPGQRRLRLAVFDNIQHPNASIAAGALITCGFDVSTSAQPNHPVSLTTDRLSVGSPCVQTPVPTPATPTGCPTIPDAQAQTMPGMILPSPTPTPTPIPCFVNQDCPLGQVCDPTTKVCKPAPTPTPTIACPNGTCPNGLTCVNGICKDLSTPTVTPTPLPTCTTDAQCVQLEGPGFQCRAGVCVPIRECSNTEPTPGLSNCRGERESCTNGKCECGGDCNLDGYVYGDEITRMTCILSEDPGCPLTDCKAGDFNGDGQITGNEVCMASTNLGLGCPGEGQPLVFAEDLTGETRSLDVGSAAGLPGATITISVNLSVPAPSAANVNVATAQLDLLFETAVLDIPDTATACAVDPRLTATNASFTYLPQTPNTPPGQARLRLFVGDMNLCKQGLTFPVGSFTQGPLMSCTFHIKATAPVGASPLTAERLNIGDPRGNDFTAVSTNGKVIVLQLTPTPTNTALSTPTNTRTNTVMPTPTNTVMPTPKNTPTVTPTSTPRPEIFGGGGGGGGCSCGIEPAESRKGAAVLLWLAVPVGLMLWRRRYRG